jgi:hypothetical protein
MRYLITTSVSRVSMWMSLARRWMALKIVESTSLMIGAGVGGDAVDRQDLLAVLVLLDELDAEVLGRLVEHALALSDFCRISSIAERHPDLDLDRLAEQQLELVDLDHVGGVGHHHRQAAVELPLGDEPVAQHQVERDAAEQVVVDPEVVHVDELEPVAGGRAPRRRGARAPGGRAIPRPSRRPGAARGLCVDRHVSIPISSGAGLARRGLPY